jgi:hypothetical protein
MMAAKSNFRVALHLGVAAAYRKYPSLLEI